MSHSAVGLAGTRGDPEVRTAAIVHRGCVRHVPLGFWLVLAETPLPYNGPSQNKQAIQTYVFQGSASKRNCRLVSLYSIYGLYTLRDAEHLGAVGAIAPGAPPERTKGLRAMQLRERSAWSPGRSGRANHVVPFPWLINSPRRSRPGQAFFPLVSSLERALSLPGFVAIFAAVPLVAIPPFLALVLERRRSGCTKGRSLRCWCTYIICN